MNTKLYRMFSLLLALMLAFAFLQPVQAAPGDTIRVSLDANGAQTAGAQQENSISGDGRYIAFVTPFALVTADTNGLDDVYVRDTQNNTTLLVSVANDGTLGNNVSAHPAMSANGQFVVFQSNATTLTSNGIAGIFVRDLVNNTTVIVSVNNSGTPTPSPTFYPSISADGRYVTFTSWARQNLTANCGLIGDNVANVYRRDTVANITTCVSVDNSGNQMTGGNATISGDGRYVIFASGLQLYARDTLNNTTTLMSVDSNGNPGNAESTDQASVSYDGRFVAFNSAANNLIPNDTNGWKDTFVHDRDTDTDGIFDEPGAITTYRVSVASDGAQGTAYSLYPPSISADGRFVAFTSRAKNLVPGIAYDTEELYLRDTLLNTTSRISVSSSGVQASSSSQLPSMSANGHFVSFSSYSSDLVSGDTNGNTDIFRRELTVVGVPSVSLSPISLTFSTRTVGTASAAQTVTLTNNGGADLHVGTLTASGDFALTADNCSGQTVAAGNPCTFGVTFTPTASGARSGSISIASDAASSPDSVSLSGSGQNEAAPTNILLTNSSIAENLPGSTVVGSLSAIDPDTGDTASFSFCGGADDASFSINGNTLESASTFNFETKNSYAICIRATDSYTLTFDKNLTINITNVNEAPVITSNGGGATANLSVPENTSAVTTASASDPDAGTSLAYSISGGADSSKFSINPSSGALTFITAPNFEAPGDAGADNVYDVTVQVSDGSLTDAQDIAVTVTDANDAPTNIALSNASVAENLSGGATVGSLSSTDIDPGDTFTYSFCSGADNASFSILGATLKTAASFDFETKNSYSICIRSTDSGALTFDKNFTVNITNVNEAPVITSNGGGATAGVNVAENSTAVTTVSTSDPDAGATKTFSISGGADAAKFNINSFSGLLTFITAPNFELPTDSGLNNVYDVIVQVSDGTLVDTQAIAVTVTNVNEAPNNILVSASSLAENQAAGTTVGTISSTDVDAGDSASYSFCGGTDDASFSITGASLKSAVSFDFETKSSYSICLRATDLGGQTFNKNFTITVTNVNDAPVITSNGGGDTANLSVAENTTAVTTVTSTDQDAGATKTYTIAGGADAAKFSINAVSGALTFLTAPNFETPTDSGADNVYDVQVRVSDGTLTDTQSIAVTVTNANEAPTSLSLSNASLLENQPVGTTVGTLSSTDPDAGDTFTYTFCGGVNDSSFSISGNALKTAAVFDFETKNSYSICVRTNDSGLLGVNQVFLITVINDPSPVELISPANSAILKTNGAIFDWADYPAANQYQVEFSRNNTFTQKIGLTWNTSTSSLAWDSYSALGNLPTNTLVFWRVRAYLGSFQYSPWSSVWSFTTANPPSVLSLVSPTVDALVAGPSPLLDWSDATVPAGMFFDHYQVQIATDTAFTNIVHDRNISGLANSQETTEVLNPGAKYYWRARSVAANGDYSLWRGSSFSLQYDKPVLTSPANLSIISSLRPPFTWNVVSGASNYRIQVSTSSTFASFVVNTTTNPGVTSYTPTTSLKVNTTYFWRVSALGTFGPSDNSTVFQFTTFNPPPIPTPLSPSGTTVIDSSLPTTFTWTSVIPGAGVVFDYYQIQVATDSGFTNLVHDHNIPGAVNNHDDDVSLAPATTYFWRVRSVSASGSASFWSNVIMFKTRSLAPTLLGPTDGSVVASLRPTFTWSAPPGTATFTIQISKTNTFGLGTINATVSSPTYTPTTNLAAHTTYFWRVYATGPYPSNLSTVFTFTTP